MAKIPYNLSMVEPEDLRDDTPVPFKYMPSQAVVANEPSPAREPTRLPEPAPRDLPNQQNPNIDPIPAPDYNVNLDAPQVFKPYEAPQVDEDGFAIKDDPSVKVDAPKQQQPAAQPKDAGKKKEAAPQVAPPPQAPEQKSVPFGDPYTPPQSQAAPSVPQGDPFSVWGNKEVAPKEDPTDRHRSLLQAIMGWDDVPYGQKWNHYLQHGLVGVSRENLENVTAMANTEKQMMGATMGQQLRANEQKRRTLTGEWDKLLRDWNAGRYVGDDSLINLFYNRAQALRDEYEAEGFNPNTLTPPSINPGGFSQGFQKSLSDDREKLDWLGGWMEQIQKHVAEDPDWLNRPEARAEFDKLSEYVIINWAQSKGAIADAEKVRAQVETMPQADRAVFDTFMSKFFNVNAMAQLHALAAKGDYSAAQTVQSFEELMNMANNHESMSELDPTTGKYMPNAKVSGIMNAAVLAYLTLIKNQANIPNDVTAAVSSYKNARDAFQEYVMQNANVDRRAVWDMALDQYNIYKSKYEAKMPRLGLLWGWGVTPRNIDRNMGQHLAQWQNNDKTSTVMQNATLATTPLPKPVRDPMNIGRGGAGGNVRR